MQLRSMLVPVAAGSMLFSGMAIAAQHSRNSSQEQTPAQIAQRQTDRMTRFFGLSSTQQNQVLGIMTKADMQSQALRGQVKPLRESLKAEIKADQPDKINATLKQLAPLSEQIVSARAAAAGQIYATVLTSDQQAKVKNNLRPLFGAGPRAEHQRSAS